MNGNDAHARAIHTHRCVPERNIPNRTYFRCSCGREWTSEQKAHKCAMMDELEKAESMYGSGKKIESRPVSEANRRHLATED